MGWNKTVSLVLDVDDQERLIGWTGFVVPPSGPPTLKSMGVGVDYLALSEILSWLHQETQPGTAQGDGPTDG